MLKRYGLLILVLGLIAQSSVAQEAATSKDEPRQESSSPDSNSAPQQDEQPTIDYAPALQAIAAAIRDLVSKANEEERAQEAEKSRRDLRAQEGMAWWAELMFYASAASVLLTFVALIAIIRTLIHTRRAADAAEGMLKEAADATAAANQTTEIAQSMGLAEHRQYIQATLGRHISHMDEASGAVFWRIKVVLSNSGHTPTKNLRMWTFWRLTDSPMQAMPDDIPEIPFYIRGQSELSPVLVTVFGEDLAAVKRGEKHLAVFVEVSYGTALDDRAKFITKQGFMATNIGRCEWSPRILGCQS